jgi:hypothetical protein
VDLPEAMATRRMFCHSCHTYTKLAPGQVESMDQNQRDFSLFDGRQKPEYRRHLAGALVFHPPDVSLSKHTHTHTHRRMRVRNADPIFSRKCLRALAPHVRKHLHRSLPAASHRASQCLKEICRLATSHHLVAGLATFPTSHTFLGLSAL